MAPIRCAWILVLIAALEPYQPAKGASDRNRPYVDAGTPDQVLDFDEITRLVRGSGAWLA